MDEEIEIIEKISFDIKEINIPEPKKVVNEVKKFHQINENPVPIPLTVKQSPPVKRHSRIYQNFSKSNPIPEARQYRNFPQTQNKLQSLVDLIMWRDVSRSAFVFGIGAFVIISSSYAEDINVSFISVISYLGLAYLAAIFLYRSLICRGAIDVDDTRYVVGEQEAIWVLKLFLPYLNEFLSKLRALFSGDPSTTMKLAVLLFVLARCGSSITIWKMAKFGFFGIFTVPKVCSSYSAQLTAYAKFWFRRFKDAWDSCYNKKAVAIAIFTLVWNLSSIVARIWAVFMMFVAVRYYQQNLVRDDWVEDVAEGGEETWQSSIGEKIQGNGPTLVEVNKAKKGSQG
ncbi:Reticulon-like protein [Quillaja saponaria]|uniref:Reticulon-like protein n=1 Tax=Quillaja saponaria TaxID=32244 RepID=A0AAD7LCJ7_QUISA|nr:Reticulon-like protein [Quillaja saponaria]